MVSTGTGFVESTVVWFPSCPCSLRPQQYALPSALRTQLCATPAVMNRKPESCAEADAIVNNPAHRARASFIDVMRSFHNAWKSSTCSERSAGLWHCSRNKARMSRHQRNNANVGPKETIYALAQVKDDQQRDDVLPTLKKRIINQAAVAAALAPRSLAIVNRS